MTQQIKSLSSNMHSMEMMYPWESLIYSKLAHQLKRIRINLIEKIDHWAQTRLHLSNYWKLKWKRMISRGKKDQVCRGIQRISLSWQYLTNLKSLRGEQTRTCLQRLLKAKTWVKALMFHLFTKGQASQMVRVQKLSSRKARDMLRKRSSRIGTKFRFQAFQRTQPKNSSLIA